MRFRSANNGNQVLNHAVKSVVLEIESLARDSPNILRLMNINWSVR